MLKICVIVVIIITKNVCFDCGKFIENTVYQICDYWPCFIEDMTTRFC